MPIFRFSFPLDFSPAPATLCITTGGLHAKYHKSQGL